MQANEEKQKELLQKRTNMAAKAQNEPVSRTPLPIAPEPADPSQPDSALKQQRMSCGY